MPLDDTLGRNARERCSRSQKGQKTVRDTMVDNVIAENHVLTRENEVLRKYILLQKENSDLKTMGIITNALAMCDGKLDGFKMRLYASPEQGRLVSFSNTTRGKQPIKSSIPDRNKVTFGSDQPGTPSYGASFPEVRLSELETSDDDVFSFKTSDQNGPKGNYGVTSEASESESNYDRQDASTSYGQSFRELDYNELRADQSGTFNTSENEKEPSRPFDDSASEAQDSVVDYTSQTWKDQRSSPVQIQRYPTITRPRSPSPIPSKPIRQPAMRFSMEPTRHYPRKPSPTRVNKDNQAQVERKRRSEIRTQYSSRGSANKSSLKNIKPNKTTHGTIFYDSLEHTDTEEPVSASTHLFRASNDKQSNDFKMDHDESSHNDGAVSFRPNVVNGGGFQPVKQTDVRLLNPATGNGGTSYRSPSPIYVNADKRDETAFLTVTKTTNTDYLRSTSPAGLKESVAISSQTSRKLGSSGGETDPRSGHASIERQSPRFGGSQGQALGYGYEPLSTQTQKSPRNQYVKETTNKAVPVQNDSFSRYHHQPSLNSLDRKSPSAGTRVNSYKQTSSGSPIANDENQTDESVWVNITTRARILNENYDGRHEINVDSNKVHNNTIVKRQSAGDDKKVYRKTVVGNQREGDDSAFHQTTVERQRDGEDNSSYRKEIIGRQNDGDDKSVYRRSVVEKQKDGDSNKYQHTVVERQKEGEDNKLYRKTFVGKQNDGDRSVYHHTTVERQDDGEANRIYRKTTVEKKNDGEDNRVFRKTIFEKQKEGDHNVYHHTTVERQNEGEDTKVYRKSFVESQRNGLDDSVNRRTTIERQTEGEDNKVYRKTVVESQRGRDENGINRITTIEREHEDDDSKVYRKTIVERQRGGDDTEVYHHTAVERQSVVAEPAVPGFRPIGSPLFTSTQIGAYSSRERGHDSGQQTTTPPIVRDEFEAKIKHFAAVAEKMSPANVTGLNQLSPVSTRYSVDTADKYNGSPSSVVTRGRIASTVDSIGSRQGFDRSLIDAVYNTGSPSGTGEQVKSVLFRPVDTLTGYEPQVTTELAGLVLGTDPCRRLVGEIAFQLDRRIMEFVFGPRRNSEDRGNTRSRYYGYSLVNIRQLIKKEASLIGRSDPDPDKAERAEQELSRKLNNIITVLEPLGYDFNSHPEFTQDVVNKYGLMRQAPDHNTIEWFGLTKPVILRMLLGRLVGHGPVLDNVLILLDCLCYLSWSDKTPLFKW